MKKIVVVILLIVSQVNFGQTRIELNKNLDNAKKFSNKNIDSSTYYLLKCKKLLSSIDKQDDIVLEYYNQLAYLESVKGNFLRSDSILKISNKASYLTDKNGLFHRLNNNISLARNQFQRGEFINAMNLISMVNDSIDVLKGNVKQYKSLKYKLNKNKAIVFANLGKIKEAENLFFWVYTYTKQQLSEENNESNILAYTTSINNLALCYEYLNKSTEALNLYYKALPITEKYGFEESNIILKNNISRLFFYNEEYEKILKICNSILNNTKFPRHNLKTILYTAHAYNNLDSLEIAKSYYLKGLKKAKKMNMLLDQANTEINLGDVYLKIHKLDSAFFFLKSGKKKLSKSGSNNELGKVYSNLGKYYLLTNNMKLAKDNLLLAEDEFIKSNNNKRAQFYNENQLSLYYEKKGNYKEALNWINKKYETQLDYSNERSKYKVLDIETKYQTQQKENEILKLKNEKVLQETSLVKSRYIIFGILGLLVMGLVAGYLYWNKRKQSHQLELLENSVKTSEAEKSRIGKELHDGIAGSIMKLVHDSETAQIAFSHKLLETYNEVRSLSHQLDNTPEHGELFLDRVLDLIPESNESQKFNFTITPRHLEIYEPNGTHIYRIIQELIANNIKHSKATKTNINITLENSKLAFEYSDNGVGTKKFKKGKGYKNIDDRITLMRGTLNSKTDNGFTISFQIPYNA